MKKIVELKLVNLLIALAIAAIIPTVGAVVTTLVKSAVIENEQKNINEKLDKKVDAAILLQYLDFMEKRFKLQKEINEKGDKRDAEILNELKLLNEKIHELKVEMIGIEVFRGGNNVRWDYEKLICFAWSNGIYFN